jgi:hypothetical protein
MYGILTYIYPKNGTVLQVNIPYIEHMGNVGSTTNLHLEPPWSLMTDVSR